MVKITEELIRKRAEHNECIIGTLEELSLHQEDIEKIEHINNWCKELQILYLQANLISKIENLNKLKKLQYLNLALNNIELVENLERCESLEKLDLTLNFIGNLESVKSLKHNIFLKDLYLTGNPCSDFEGYRDFVIAVLPQLKSLDVQEITKSERIKALQKFPEIEPEIKSLQRDYVAYRAKQRIQYFQNNQAELPDDEYWKSTCENCPEARVEMANRSRKSRETSSNDEPKERKSVRLFSKIDGRPLNVNQAKLHFHFSDADPNQYVLDLSVYKFLDSNLIDVDLQPIYVKITVKDKVFQMVFPEEICTERSTAQRSQTTGHLVLTMPKMNYKAVKFDWIKCSKVEEKTKKNKEAHRKYLEVEEKNNEMDFSQIVKQKEEFMDNMEVPPLEYA